MAALMIVGIRFKIGTQREDAGGNRTLEVDPRNSSTSLSASISEMHIARSAMSAKSAK